MLKIENWLGEQRSDDWRDTDLATVRAGDVEREIGDASTSITIQRAGSSLSAQTVRLLAPTTRAAEGGSAGGRSGEVALVVLGASDLDVQFGDRFLVSGQFYEVFHVVPGLVGRVEAWAKQVQ